MLDRTRFRIMIVVVGLAMKYLLYAEAPVTTSPASGILRMYQQDEWDGNPCGDQ